MHTKARPAFPISQKKGYSTSPSSSSSSSAAAAALIPRASAW
eukprot:CAMPEP_0202346058 /NCGR_PEP_ID=MMETSP1126-20121109/5014_1 /ASSEMBLY_ACC=CAM_ASM_000457 /TAXON_ID=3047 /ORGANISM="Dunaliella tertiolecta, Strain CCMP1320" /LENGTH=41 /DNA_ID= /DNA_START= /DNA_END= /DNA_ORIENTATION=